MTTTTPPGWYAEPGHTGNGPAMERWWDGSAWTEYTRTAPDPAAQPAVYPGYPGQPGYPPGPSSRRRRGTVIAIVLAVVLVAGSITALVLVNSNGSSSNDAKSPSPQSSGSASPRQRGPGGGGSPAPSGGPRAPKSDGSTAIDGFDGISLPVLNGWQGETDPSGVGADVVTGQYPCPGDATKSCVRGGVFVQPAEALKITATTPEAAAKQDIAPNSANSYSTDIYGKTTSHQEVLSEAVTVAGQRGYRVRWKIATASGTGGYVESLAFVSPHDPKRLIVLRFGFDIGGQAPGVGVIDQITQGITSVPITNTTGGSSSGTTGGTGV